MDGEQDTTTVTVGTVTVDSGSIGSYVSPMAPTPIAQPAPQPPSEDWQRRFTGLQQSLQKTLELTGWGKQDAIPKRSDVEAWRNDAARLPDVQAQLDALTAAKGAVETEKQQLANQLQERELEVRKASMMSQQAPDLFAFLSYIPAKAEEAEQLQEFENFRQQLSRVSVPGQAPRAAPPATQPAMGSKPATTVELWAQMQKALSEGNTAEYDRLKELWYAAE